MNDMEKLNQMRKVLQDSLFYKFDDESCTMVIEIDKTAKNLIAHGVTVRTLRKPLTLDEAIEMSKDEHTIFYVESNLQNSIVQSDYWGSVNFWLNKCVEKQRLRNEYGRSWRCWANRPTDEERESAEWCR